MQVVLFDVETNGLLDELDRVHCIAAGPPEGEVKLYHDHGGRRDGTLAEGLELLASADVLVAHNLIGFDLPALRKACDFEPRGLLWDTLVVSRLAYPDLRPRDFARKDLPGRLIGRHSLEAWGYRLGVHKGDYKTHADWSRYSEEMGDYCVQDVRVLQAIYGHLKDYPPKAVALEHEFAEAIEAMIQRGVAIDKALAWDTIGKLRGLEQVAGDQLRASFGDFTEVYFTPKKKLRRERTIRFNPNSTDHLVRGLREKYGWRPTRKTNTGKAALDAAVLETLDYPEIEVIKRYRILSDRRAQLEGIYEKIRDGRVHPFVVHNGTVTGRCSHSNPNVNVPRVGSPWGMELRSVFVPSPGYVMVGADIGQADLRAIAHYLHRYDGGALARDLDSGDMHTTNAKEVGIDRNLVKGCTYAVLYGAGSSKLVKQFKLQPAQATKVHSYLTTRYKGLAALQADLLAVVDAKRHLRLMDGRFIYVRNPRAALNSLAQGGAAVMVKAWTAAVHDLAKQRGLRRGEDWNMVLHVHDEMQFECRPSCVDDLRGCIMDALDVARERLSLRVGLTADVKVGNNWAETH